MMIFPTTAERLTFHGKVY